MFKLRNITFWTIPWLALAGMGWHPKVSAAQLKIDDVEIGFPSAEGTDGTSSCYKAGEWTPVRIHVRSGGQPYAGGRLWIETWDSDDVLNRYPVPIPPLGANGLATIEAFARPGSVGAEIRLTGDDANGTPT